jgi:hypothetical protein
MENLWIRCGVDGSSDALSLLFHISSLYKLVLDRSSEMHLMKRFVGTQLLESGLIVLESIF